MSTDENREMMIFAGMGTVADCCDRHLDAWSSDAVLCHDLVELRRALGDISSRPYGNHILRAIACAILNTDYMRDGILHGYDPKEGYNGIVETDMDKRQLMYAGLLMEQPS